VSVFASVSPELVVEPGLASPADSVAEPESPHPVRESAPARRLDAARWGGA